MEHSTHTDHDSIERHSATVKRPSTVAMIGAILLSLTGFENASADQNLNYSYLYFENGFPARSSGRRPQSDTNTAAKANPDLVFQTGYYSLMLDCDDMTLKGYDSLSGTDYLSALTQDVTTHTPANNFLLRVYQNGVAYDCDSALVNSTSADSIRMIESGQYVKRIDHLGLIFKDANGNQLQVDDECRLEITAWPDRITFFLDFSAETTNPITRTTIQVVSPDGVELSADSMANQAHLTIKPQNNEKLSPLNPNDYITDTKNLQNASALTTTFDDDLAAFHIEVPSDHVSYPGDKERVDEFVIEVTNPHSTTQNIPLVFDQPSPRTITGTTMVLCDEINGRPIGIPVQISKNWHRKFVNGSYVPTVHDGPWLRGSTMVTMAPNETRRFKLRVAFGYWGNAGAISHSQLSLIGYGGNWQWDESAMGAWGEAFCYDPTQHLGGAFLDDVRPIFTNSYGNSTTYGWTENVGGGDFLIYRDSNDTYRWGKKMKTCYHWSGPNMSEVFYTGVTDDDKIRFTYRASAASTNDYHRRFHDYKYEFLEDVVNPERLVFYQMEADHYNSATYTNYFIGDEAGSTMTGTIDAGGDVYKGSPILMDGKWLSIEDELGGSETAHAMRGIIPLNTTLNGSSMPVYLHRYGVNYGSDMTFDFAGSSAQDSYNAGDVVTGEIHFVMPPKQSSSYWGDDTELVNRLDNYGYSAWEMVRDEFKHNVLMDVVMQQGTMLRSYPLVVQPNNTNNVLTDFTVQGGGLGHIPLTIKAAERGLELTAQRWGDGVWSNLTGVPIDDNKYYQGVDNPDGTTDYVFNIPRPNHDLDAAWRVRIIAADNYLDSNALVSLSDGGLSRDDFGFHKTSGSAWAIEGESLVNNSSTNNNVGEGAIGMSVDLSALPYTSSKISLSFQYTINDPAEKLFVHLWGMEDVSSTAGTWIMNLGAQNGNAWVSSGSAMTAYNLGKSNGAFAAGAEGYANDAAIILSGQTGTHHYSGTFDISDFMGAPNSTDGYRNLILAFAREVGGTSTPGVSISDIKLSFTPEAPSAPTGLTATSGTGQVAIDWADSLDSDFESFTIYRSSDSGASYQAIASGLTSSYFVDDNTSNTNNYYVITAWNTDGVESTFSGETLGIVNQAPSFDDYLITSPTGTEGAPYSGSIAGTASDPESDMITYSKASGPTWLEVAADGTLSGSPAIGDGGLNSFTVMASAEGGSDTCSLEINLYQIDYTLLDSSTIVENASPWVRLQRNDIGFKKDASSLWSINNGVISNPSNDNSKVGSAVYGCMVDLTSIDSGPQNLVTLSFDYTTADPAEELVVHLWGYTDVSSTGSTFTMNTESTHGHVWESSAGALTPHNLAAVEGAFTNNGGRGDAIAILSGSAGTQSFSMTFDLTQFAVAPSALNQFDYLTLGFARNVANAPNASVSISNLSLTASIKSLDAPSGLVATPALDAIDLDWDNSTAADFASYSVYRSTSSGSGYELLASGLTSSAYTDDTASGTDSYYYQVTVWNTNDVESGLTTEVSSTVNLSPAFVYYDPIIEIAAIEGEAYTSDVLIGSAADPEGDSVSYSKLSGPNWLSVAADGSLTGTPGSADIGDNSFTIQATALGGSDTITLEVPVNPSDYILLTSADMTNLGVEYRLLRDSVGVNATSDSAWTLTNGVLENTSTTNNRVAEGAAAAIIDLTTLPNEPHNQILLSFDYELGDSAETLYVHLWGYVENANPSSSGTMTMNLGASNGNAWESSGSIFDEYNLGGIDGAWFANNTVHKGQVGATAVTLGGTTGPQSYSGVFDISEFITAPSFLSDYDYIAIGFARQIDGTVTPSAKISNVSLTATIKEVHHSIASAEVAVTGTHSGSLADADISDDVYLSLSEVNNGTTSEAEHKWIFQNVPDGDVSFHLEAHHSLNNEADDFVFAYSLDGISYSDMFTVTKTSDDDSEQSFALPAGSQGSIYIRTRDTDRSANNSQLDTLLIDTMYIQSE